jgi:AcrR family transcriptional regulator
VPRAGLTPQAVVDLALHVVDEGGPSGWADLSLSAVAHRAGVAVPSLYKHVDGLPALRSAVAARCVEELTEAMRNAIVDRSDADALRALADATRAYALAHPGRYRAVQGAEATALGGRAAAPAELIAHVVGELGLPRERWVDQVRAVRAAVHGFVELELGGGFGLPEDVEASFRYLVETVVTGLR